MEVALLSYRTFNNNVIQNLSNDEFIAVLMCKTSLKIKT